ncbi:hypothetical protein EW145_g3391 [Phellinidium pouzarii]|uniref:WW domain-containing protein n=1 Tax=Phellinidium pouzarii TaxID=167371 RepID=A0A4S4L8S6_9AGAM|nr:hypothetical protein EW145_g3391 [Phellinidium pouzarii]
MAPRLVLIAIQRLLDKLGRWGHQSLYRLLWIISLFIRHGTREGSDTSNPREIIPYADACVVPKLEKDVVEIFEPPTLNNSTSKRASVLSWSSLPLPPSKAYTHQNARSIESYFSEARSPTLMNPPDGGDEQHSCINMAILEEGTSYPSGTFTAEPAHIVAEPRDMDLRCTTPSTRPRYERHITIECAPGPWEFAPTETFTVYEKEHILPWESFTNPEGQVYFKNSYHKFVYLTEADLYDVQIRENIELVMTEIEKRASDFGKELPTKIEVLLEFEDDFWSYYMIDLDRCCIFWLDYYDGGRLIPLDFGIEKREHFRHLLDYEYWLHIEHFPCQRELKEGALEELLGVLNHSIIDYMTSNESTSPYSDMELRTMIDSIKDLRARLMTMYSNERFHNFFGYNGVRLSVDQSVRGTSRVSRSWLIGLLSPVLFYAPDTHLAMLEKLYIDGMIKALRWKTFRSKLQDDWSSFVLTSTVLLSANVAFLAIPSVQSFNGPELWTSPAAVPSLVSIVTSLGSIIVGLLLIRQLRISAKDQDSTARDAISYLQKRKHPQLGLETMAIQYSLPYALLMWSVNGGPNAPARAVYGCVWLFILVLILWTVFTGLETSGNFNWRQLKSFSWWKTALEAESVVEGDSDTAIGSDDCSVSGQSHKSTMRQASPWHSRVRKFAPMRRFTFVTGKRSHN